MSVGCVVLTQGRRPAELARAVASLLEQSGVERDVVVVGNGWAPADLPAGARGVHRPTDEGIPAGRNFGVAHVRGELLFFLDDDARLLGEDALAAVEAAFARDPRLGAAQLRVEPTDGTSYAREWVPRLRAGDRTRSGEATHMWEGAVAIRRALFERIGRWPADFRFVHEGIDLGWRVMDAGYRVGYLAEAAVAHPPYSARNDWDYYYGARNRVWLARRYLPRAMGASYVGLFALRTVPRLDSGAKRRAALRGYRDGLRGPGGERAPLSRRTLWRMARLGRLPVL